MPIEAKEDRRMSNLTATIAETVTTDRSVSLKTQLHRAERMKKLKYGALIVPLALFLLFRNNFV